MQASGMSAMGLASTVRLPTRGGLFEAAGRTAFLFATYTSQHTLRSSPVSAVAPC